jgi:hypothetical protein
MTNIPNNGESFATDQVSLNAERCYKYQMHDLATTLLSEGLAMVQFQQSVSRSTQLDQNLYELIKHGNLVTYPDDDLRSHISHAVATDSSRGW